MLINLTPHTLKIYTSDEPGAAIVHVEPSGKVARIDVYRTPMGQVEGIAVYRATSGEVYGLPNPVDGTVYVTSLVVARAAGRPDVVSPGDLVRDSDGHPIHPVACLGLTSWEV